MRFLIDAQLPPLLAEQIKKFGYEAIHVEEVGLRQAKDLAIWNYSLDEECVIVTKDEDFVFRALATNSAPVIIWLRVGNCSDRALLSWFVPLFSSMEQSIHRGEKIIEVQ